MVVKKNDFYFCIIYMLLFFSEIVGEYLLLLTGVVTLLWESKKDNI